MWPLCQNLAAALIFVPGLVSAFKSNQILTLLESTTLGPDPPTVNRLNGESFQQEGLVTFAGYQYAALWTPSPSNASIRHITLSRRALTGVGDETNWNSITFTDYNQTDDDGHDIITLGVSKGDGTIHFAFDEHDGPFHYRVSQPELATSPQSKSWSTESFGGILAVLPGLEDIDLDTHFVNVTYPRFISLPQVQIKKDGPDLMLEYRVGRSGLGDDWLFLYTPTTGHWDLVGRYLLGVNNNAYINGLDFDAGGSLHVTWTYRDYINDTGFDVAVEAGPNGPENNHDLVYAHSPDLGYTWYNNWNQSVASLISAASPGSGSSALDGTISPTSAGVTVFSIPKYGGILNQEAQTVDWQGRVHVLNRENGTGTERWFHYWRSPTPSSASSPDWHRAIFPVNIPGDPYNVTGTPTVIGKRGKLVAVPPSSSSSTKSGAFTTLAPVNSTASQEQEQGTTLLAVLPSNAANSSALTIFASTSARNFQDWEVVWTTGSGCGWEPIFDRYRLVEGDGVLSLYMINGTEVQVWDFGLDGL